VGLSRPPAKGTLGGPEILYFLFGKRSRFTSGRGQRRLSRKKRNKQGLTPPSSKCRGPLVSVGCCCWCSSRKSPTPHPSQTDGAPRRRRAIFGTDVNIRGRVCFDSSRRLGGGARFRPGTPGGGAEEGRESSGGKADSVLDLRVATRWGATGDLQLVELKGGLHWGRWA